MWHDVALIVVSFLVGVVTSSLLYKEEARVYDRLVEALHEGEAAFNSEVARIKSELTKIHL